jgi:methionyl-tRNA formyltransferase
MQMRVAVMGQAAFGEAVLKRLAEAGFELVGVSAPPPREGARPDALWAAGEAAGIPLVATESLKTADGIAAWRKTGADLAVMAFVTDIIPAEALAAPRLGTIQYHPSLLPLHRGSSAMNWAIINQDAETGLTIFWPDEGIDTGPVLLQKTCPIGPNETVASIYFDRLFPMGVEALVESAQIVAAGAAPRIEQDHRLATYEPPCTDVHGRVRWHEPAQRIHAVIRGCNPQPGAWTVYEGDKLRFFDCELTGQEEAGMPGRILRVGETSFEVRLNGGVLRVHRVQAPGQKKMPAAEWARAAGIDEGFRFR